MKFRGQQLGIVRGATILFDASAITEETNAPFWVQIAQAGVYKGYSQGTVTFDLAMFTKVIENFRAHPWYKAGADGVGMNRVIPFDYEHASEADPTSGTIPQAGAPAPAWALELEMRDGGDLGPQLWALTLPVNDEVRASLKQGSYLSTSVAIWNNAVDGISGAKIGPMLTSIAFTNHPFIEGMAPITLRVDQWGEAESLEELIIGLRLLFGLDVAATPADILAQIVALKGAFENNLVLPAYPDGVAPLIDRLRCLIGLPVLTPATSIIEAAGQAVSGMPASPSPQPTETEGSPTMALDPKRLIVALRVPAAVIAAKGGDEEVAILFAAEQGAQATDAISQLQALFGSSDTKDLISKASEAITAAEKVKGLVESLKQAQDSLSEQDKEVADGEVDAVAASLKLSSEAIKRLRPTLLKQRLEAGKDKEALKRWREENGVKPGERSASTLATRTLTTSLVAGTGGAQFGSEATGAGESDEQDHPMLGYPGRNVTEKACAYLSEKVAGFSKHSRRDQLVKAAKYIKDGARVFA